MVTDFPADFLSLIDHATTARNGKRERDEIRFRCPSEDHPDEHPSARWNRKKATWCCDGCGAGGGVLELADCLGIPRPDHRRQGGVSTSGHIAATAQYEHGCTLEQYSEAKRIPIEFLRQLGLTTISDQGAPSVRMPYRTADGAEVSVRIRKSLEGKERFRWRSGSKPQLYGQDRLHEAVDRAHVVLVEGESDSHTLWYHDKSAVGIPGANGWKEERDAPLLSDIPKIYVVIEPDSGGETVRKWLDHSSIRERAHLLDLGEHKDPSGLYLADPENFSRNWEAALEAATPWINLATSERREELSAAWGQCQEIAQAPSILDLMADALAAAGVAGERRTLKLLYLILSSRFLDRPVSAAIKGPSSGGKSYTLEQVLRLIPKDGYYALSAMSEKALAYGEEPLSHRFLVIYEAAGLTGDFASYLIRSLLSEGRLRYETVEKTSEGMRPRLIEREGPTGLLVTTTAIRLHPENETRFLSIPVTDTREQTRQILRATAREARPHLDIEPWLAFQTWLAGSEHRVTIPFAEELSELVPPLAVRLRRDFRRLLDLIQTHAILHQSTRDREDKGRIVATLDDYAAIRILVADLIAEGVDATVTATMRETVEAVRTLLDASSSSQAPGILGLNVRDESDRSVSLLAVAETLGLDKSTASRRVKAGCSRGLLRNLESKKNQPMRIVLCDPLPAETVVLPEVSTLAARCGIAVESATDTTPSPANDDPAMQATVANLLSLTPQELNAYREELSLKSASNPDFLHDQEALRRAEAILARTSPQDDSTQEPLDG